MKINLIENLSANENKILVFSSGSESLSNLSFLSEMYDFNGSVGQVVCQNEMVEGKMTATIYCGVGDTTNPENIRKGFAKMFKKLGEFKADTYSVDFSGANGCKGVLSECFALVSTMCLYTFDKYKTNAKEKTDYTFNIVSKPCEKRSEKIAKAIALGEGVNIARDLGNMTAGDIYPESLGEIAVKYGEEFGFETTVMHKEDLEKDGCNTILAVGQGSKKTPTMIIMKYNGGGDEPYTAFIGKGITFDSGGYFLKGRDGIVTMKCDMCGGGDVIGLMTAVAKNKVNKNVMCVIPAAESLIGSNALIPGDVITTRNKKTVEITNTDAEGRLVLIDALDYVCSMDNVKEVVDIATLTGASAMVFGGVCCSTTCSDDEFFAKADASAKKTGEKIWRMPLFDEYKENILSDIADYRNTGKAPLAGSITAAMFMKEFTYGKPWLHLDVAGVAHTKVPTTYAPVGSTGFGVRLMYDLLMD